MKTILQTVLGLVMLSTMYLYAQAPQKFNYQGVARNASGNPLVNTNIGLQLSITDGVTALYTESFSVSTNSLGLFNVEVGGGTVVTGVFNTIDWGSGAKFIRSEMDATGGTSYVDMGTSQLLSVPYALYAGNSTPGNINDLLDVNTSGGVSLNQVLQWNGTEWVPATISVGGGDNWGAQTVSTNIDISGNGTFSNPLTIAQQGATNGQVLRWNGVAWTPSSITGDNWGSQSVSTSSQFSGNGTPVSPLILAQQGAASGDVLKWNGISWMPAIDDSLSLPYDAISNSSNTLFRITNSGSGTSIKGVNSSSLANTTGIVGQIQNITPGAGSSAVMGVNNGTNGNGYGVSGMHQGSGVGTYGSSATGIGILGVATGIGGTGVLGQGNVDGVKGTTNSSTGYGIHGVAVSGGYGGYFEGRSAIYSNSNAGEPNLLISETEATDYARLRLGNATVGQFWEINALTTGTAATETFNIWNGISGPLLTIKGNGNVGIGTAPNYKLHVNGNIAFAGPLLPFGNAGTSGQVLQSNGPATAPSWVTPANVMYSNTYMYDGTGGLNLLNTSQFLPGLDNISFSSSNNFKLLVSFSAGSIHNLNNFGGGDANVQFVITLKDNLNNTIKTTRGYGIVENGKTGSVAFNMVHGALSPGNYTLSISSNAMSGGDTDVYVSGGIYLNNADQQLMIQVIPQ